MPDHTLTSEQVPLASLTPHPRNPRNGDVEAIAESLRMNGQYRPLVVTEDGTILAGNHTYMAAAELGWEQVYVVRLAIHPDSSQAHRIMLADNRTADLGNYDDGVLADLLQTLDEDEGGLVGTGYGDEDLSRLLASLDEGLDFGDDDGREPTTGELLMLADVTVGEPTHKPGHGSRWRLGDHVLVVARVHDEHHLWAPLLDGRVFAPYPDPFVVATDWARENTLLLVQPDPYLAGHLLDKWASMFGEPQHEGD